MEWLIITGSQPERPAEVEVSKTHTFIRRNIEQIEKEDEMSGATITYWQYLEAKIPNEETSLIVKAVQELNAENLEAQAEAIEELAEIIGGLE